MTRTAVVVVLDSLRYDIWSKYVGETDGPFARLEATGTSFEHATATAPWSLPSHASILTGLDPDEHRTLSVEDAVPSAAQPLPSGLPAEIASACFTSNPFVTPEYGFSGWGEHETYWRPYPEATEPSPNEDGVRKYLSALETTVTSGTPLRSGINALSRLTDRVGWLYDDGGSDLISGATSWLDRLDRSQDAFLFANLMETHDPHRWLSSPVKRLRNETRYQQLKRWNDEFTHGVYEGTVKLEDLDPQGIRQLVRDELQYVERQFDRLRRALKQTGRLSDSLLIVCSDHGDGFGENGFVYHIAGLTEAILNTPLVVRAPESDTGSVSRRVSLAWIAPTVREYFQPGTESTTLLDPDKYPPYVGARNTDRLEVLVDRELSEQYTVDRRSVYRTDDPSVTYRRIGTSYEMSPAGSDQLDNPDEVIACYERGLNPVSGADTRSDQSVENRLSELGYI